MGMSLPETTPRRAVGLAAAAAVVVDVVVCCVVEPGGSSAGNTTSQFTTVASQSTQNTWLSTQLPPPTAICELNYTAFRTPDRE